MIRLGDGKWAKDLALTPGRYEYLFFVDDTWVPTPPPPKQSQPVLGSERRGRGPRTSEMNPGAKGDKEGGRVRHPEFRTGPPPVVSHEDDTHPHTH